MSKVLDIQNKIPMLFPPRQVSREVHVMTYRMLFFKKEIIYEICYAQKYKKYIEQKIHTAQ